MQIICDTFPEVFHRFSPFFFLKDIKTGQIVALMNFLSVSEISKRNANYCHFSFHRTCSEHFIKRNVERNLSVAYRCHHCHIKHLQFLLTYISSKYRAFTKQRPSNEPPKKKAFHPAYNEGSPIFEPHPDTNHFVIRVFFILQKSARTITGVSFPT